MSNTQNLTVDSVVDIVIDTTGKSFTKSVKLGDLGLTQSQIDSPNFQDDLNEAVTEMAYDSVDYKWEMPCPLAKANLDTNVTLMLTFGEDVAYSETKPLRQIISRGKPSSLSQSQFNDIIEELHLIPLRNNHFSFDWFFAKVA